MKVYAVTSIFVIVVLEKVFMYMQKDYTLIHERITVEYYNTEFFEKFKIVRYFHTRYEKRYNCSVCVRRDIYGTHLTDNMRGYKFQSNEYREFPLAYKENACDGFKSNKYGIRETLKHYYTNITLRDDCLIKQGCYFAHRVFLDESKLPPYAPRGRYMVDYYSYLNDTILLTNMKWYFEVKPTNPLERVIVG